MEIWERATGKEYSKEHEWGKEEYWNNQVSNILKRIGLEGMFEIVDVCLGNASYPVNEIKLNNGLMIFDEENSPTWAKNKNNEILNQYYINELWSKHNVTLEHFKTIAEFRDLSAMSNQQLKLLLSGIYPPIAEVWKIDKEEARNEAIRFIRYWTRKSKFNF
ncbi:hypothetical protein FDB52_02915 [Clostridium botulinum]|uniref:hypothetical protein n=1 Tax=Clostridium botulinum TaxID=1491 RepID=UPI00077466FE|nr:hypothetical protein [Clostridium botulinum]NFE93701.1 hypothetical protein [Clostridium botulinum]NFL38451.1 hypothetical protein [Clostridium botulinum]NFL65891.1 hypothetical protein [Clostridium botulinum]NFN08288.1 hypothetical protein [Clostridium botulinum]NFN18469.1 hypothetical protein [Clostridium botulinum]